jgi:hypothetical protein
MNARTLFTAALLSTSVHVQAADPGTLCETKTSALATAVFKHCKAGDLVKVDSYELQRVCDLAAPVIAVQSEYLCTYRGTRRIVRERPLSKNEKALESENVDALVEKYKD